MSRVPERLAQLLKSRVFLAGPTGVGKSTVGRLLAEHLGWPFVDADRLVQAQAGKTVEEIFASEGEAGFRRRERRAVRQIAAMGSVVAAVGGGAILDPGLRALLASRGRVVCLTMDEGQLIERLRAAPRPVLPPPDEPSFVDAAGEAIRRRLEACRGLGPQVDVTGMNPEQIVGRILSVLGGDWADGAKRGVAPPWSLRLSAGGRTSVVWGQPEVVARGRTDGMGPGEASYWKGRRVLLVSSPVPYCLYGEELAAAWERSGAWVRRFLVPDGETAKSGRWLSQLWSEWASLPAEREDLVVAVGGGAVSDLAGLAAATYLRGLRWGVVPTTLLAQADAALGGKVAIDLPQGKNLIGAFHQPEWVLVDVRVLSSLPLGEKAGGMAEVVKCAILSGEDFLACLEEHAGELVPCPVEAPDAGDEAPCTGDEVRGMRPIERDGLWNDVVFRCLALKARVVEQDEKESGPRQLLNLGHTVGHALESATGWGHGQAVAVGLVAACHLAARVAGEGNADHAWPERVRTLLRRLGLPVSLPRAVLPAVLERMRWDKKTREGKPRFVLPFAPGQVTWGQEVAPTLVEEVLSELAGRPAINGMTGRALREERV